MALLLPPGAIGLNLPNELLDSRRGRREKGGRREEQRKEEMRRMELAVYLGRLVPYLPR